MPYIEDDTQCQKCFWYWDEDFGKICHNEYVSVKDDDCVFFDSKYTKKLDIGDINILGKV